MKVGLLGEFGDKQCNVDEIFKTEKVAKFFRAKEKSLRLGD